MRSPLSFFFFSPAKTILSWDVLLRIGQINIKCVSIPCNSFIDIGLSVAKSWRLSGFPSPNSMKVWTLLVLSSCLYRVALSTGLGEDLLASVGTHNVYLL